MNYSIEKNTGVPAYLQLYRRMKEDIVKGLYGYGSRLPSKRTMAAEAGVSTITVEHTYELLCEEGYAEARERSGFFVIFRPSDGFVFSPEKPAVAGVHSHPHPHSHSHFHSSMYAFPFSALAKTMRRVVSDRGEEILEKSPNSGCTELREAIRLYLARNRNIYADLDQIIIGSGAEYLYSLIVGILGHERTYALESPSYEIIEKVYRAAGVRCDLLPLGPDGIRSGALGNTEATVLHISPYRSFPTGITASANKKYEYIRWAARPDHFIVEDDFESEFTLSGKAEETVFSLSENDNIIYLNTFSKTISPSLRAGYMILPKSLVGRFSEILGFCSCTVPTFEQYLLAELIESGDFERHINRVRRALRKKLQIP